MATEVQGAQVLPDPDLGPRKLTCLTKSGVPCNFCFIKFLPECTVEAPEAPHTPFTHPVPGVGGGGTGSKKTLEDHLCAKFYPNPSSHLNFYREQTDTHTHIALYVLDLVVITTLES